MNGCTLAHPGGIPQSGLAPAQLSLPSGPGALLRGGRRERMDEDKAWHSEQVKAGMEIKNLFHRAIYQQMAFFGSCNPRRLSFASHSKIASKLGIATKTVQRAVRLLERDGLIECLSKGAGRSTGTYLIIGRSKSPASMDSKSTLPGLKVHQIKEGIDQRTKDPSMSADAQTIDRGAIEKVDIPQEVIRLPFPSQEQKQEKAKAPVPKAPEPVYRPSKQATLLFKLQRKLGYSADDGQAKVFDGLEHCDKKRILDKLLTEEQLAAVRGEVEAPPPKPRAPRFAGAPVSTAPIRDESYHCVTAHRWTEAASDGVQNCYGCDAEKDFTELHAPHKSCTFSKWSDPPWLCGTTWSTVKFLNGKATRHPPQRPSCFPKS